MTSPAPALRVVLPCDDASEFRQRLAQSIAENGLFVPNARERPAGSTLRLRLELRDGTAVSGDAVVVGAGSAERPGVLVRFVRLDAESIPLDVAPVGAPVDADVAQPPGASLQNALFGDVPDLPAPAVSQPLELRVKPVMLRVEESGAAEVPADVCAPPRPTDSVARPRARSRALRLGAVVAAALAAAAYAIARWR